MWDLIIIGINNIVWTRYLVFLDGNSRHRTPGHTATSNTFLFKYHSFPISIAISDSNSSDLRSPSLLRCYATQRLQTLFFSNITHFRSQLQLVIKTHLIFDHLPCSDAQRTTVIATLSSFTFSRVSLQFSFSLLTASRHLSTTIKLKKSSMKSLFV